MKNQEKKPNKLINKKSSNLDKTSRKKTNNYYQKIKLSKDKLLIISLLMQ